MTEAQDLQAARDADGGNVIEAIASVDLEPGQLVVFEYAHTLSAKDGARLREVLGEALKPARGVILEDGMRLAGVLSTKRYSAAEIVAAAVKRAGTFELEKTDDRPGVRVDELGGSSGFLVEWFELSGGVTSLRFLELEDAARAAVEGPPLGLVNVHPSGAVSPADEGGA